MLKTLYDATLDPFGGDLAKASDSPITDELLESQLPGTKPRFEVGGVSIAGNSTKDFVFPVNPLSLGQEVAIAPIVPLSKTWDGILWTTWVSALNELTIRLANVTDRSIKIALQGFFELGSTSHGISAQPKARTWFTGFQKRSPAAQLELEKLERQMKAHDGRPTLEETKRYIELKYGELSKQRHHPISVTDDQHEQNEGRAREIAALIEEHPYIKTAIDDGWAKVCVQKDGSLALEFMHGHSVHLSAFDEATGNAKKASPAISLPGFTKAQVDARVKLALINSEITDGQALAGFGF